jgi:hypothetical protein
MESGVTRICLLQEEHLLLSGKRLAFFRKGGPQFAAELLLRDNYASSVQNQGLEKGGVPPFISHRP